MSKLKVRRLGYALGAEVTGIDISKPLDDETVAEIRKAWLEHIVLCFPGKSLDARQMREFCGRFGALDDLRESVNRHPDHSGVMVITSKPVLIDGKPTGGYGRANHWHSDYSFTDHPTSITFLHAKELPEVGGDTMFANQYMAYQSLSPSFKKLVGNLEGIHDITIGPAYAASGPEQQAKIRKQNPPVVHPAVRPHDETGRDALYVATRVRRFVGMTEEESRPMLEFLVAQAVRYEFVYRHRWTVDDLVLWDNRCALHYAVQDYDDQTQLRQMLRCSLQGPTSGRLYDPKSESVPAETPVTV